MKLQLVESSMIQAVGYDEKTETLRIVFNSGKTYEYYSVPKDTYNELMAAESKGSFMREAIIDCYSYRQVRRR